MSQYDDILNQKAVALKYDENKDAAPVIVASGKGYLAEKIMEIANENGIPVYEDNSLSTILTQMELGREIPPELYQAIVDIYAYFLNFAPSRSLKEEQEDASKETPEAPAEGGSKAPNAEDETGEN